MKINVRPVAPKMIPVPELKAGDKFVTATPLGPGTCVYTRLNVPLASPYAALTDTLGLARLDANQSVYRYPAEPATTTVGELEVGDLCSPPKALGDVYMVGPRGATSERLCMLVSSSTGMVGIALYLGQGVEMIKVEVVE